MLVWSKSAIADLEEICDFIALDKPRAALRWSMVLGAMARQAAAMPLQDDAYLKRGVSSHLPGAAIAGTEILASPKGIGFASRPPRQLTVTDKECPPAR